MDADLWTKIALGITTSIISLGGIGLTIRQYTLSAQAANREKFKFAKEFFEQLEVIPPMHAFARQMGFQALAGNRSIPPAVIQYLMSFPDPVAALKDYVAGQSNLKYSPNSGNRKLDFSGRLLSTANRRKRWVIGYAAGFLISYVITIAPYFLWLLKVTSSTTAIGLATTTTPIFLYFTVTSAQQGRQLLTAMRLVKAQNEEADRAEATAQS